MQKGLDADGEDDWGWRGMRRGSRSWQASATAPARDLPGLTRLNGPNYARGTNIYYYVYRREQFVGSVMYAIWI